MLSKFPGGHVFLIARTALATLYTVRTLVRLACLFEIYIKYPRTLVRQRTLVRLALLLNSYTICFIYVHTNCTII